MENMIKKVKAEIIKYRMIEPGDLVIAGVSGGPDSLALLHLLRNLRTDPDWSFRLHVAHVDHCLRGKEAEEEAVWVQQLAKEWGLPCTVTKIDVPAIARGKGMSFEEAGHFARKGFLRGLLQEIGAQKIALGHHADDQAETILMRFLVGAGSEGLQGIGAVNLPFIRPLLSLRRKEIELYCRENGLLPRWDPSNEDEAFLRNRIRRQVIPWLEEKINPNLVATLNRTAEIIRVDEDYLRREMQQLLPRFVGSGAQRGDEKGEDLVLTGNISLVNWCLLHPSMQRRLIRHVYQSVAAQNGKEEIQGLAFGHVEKVRWLAENGQTGKVLHLPGKVRAEKGYTQLTFFCAENCPDIERERAGNDERTVRVPGETILPELGQRLMTELVNTGELLCEAESEGQQILYLPYTGDLPKLIARSRRPGDRIFLPGMTGLKKIKTIFNEKKIPLRERDRIILICVENSIIWIPQLGLSSAKTGGVLGRHKNNLKKNRQYVKVYWLPL